MNTYKCQSPNGDESERAIIKRGWIFLDKQYVIILTSEFFGFSGYCKEDETVRNDHKRQWQEELYQHTEYIVELLVSRTRISQNVHTLVEVFLKWTSVYTEQQSLQNKKDTTQWFNKLGKRSRWKAVNFE